MTNINNNNNNNNNNMMDQQQRLPNLPKGQGRYKHQTVYVPRTNLVAVIGGMYDFPSGEGSNNNHNNNTQEHQRYDSWALNVSSSSSNQAAWQPGPVLREKRGFFVAVASDTTIYAVGGRWKQPLASVEVWDTTTQTPWGFEPSPHLRLQTARWLHAAVMIQNRFLVVMGGEDHDRNGLTSVEVLDTASSSQSCWGPELTQARSFLFSTIVNGNQIVAANVNSMEMIEFNPKANSAAELFPANAGWAKLPMTSNIPSFGSILSSPSSSGFLFAGNKGTTFGIKYVDLAKNDEVLLYAFDCYCASAVLVPHHDDGQPQQQHRNPSMKLLVIGGTSRDSSIQPQHQVELIALPEEVAPQFPFETNSSIQQDGSKSQRNDLDISTTTAREHKTCAARRSNDNSTPSNGGTATGIDSTNAQQQNGATRSGETPKAPALMTAAAKNWQPPNLPQGKGRYNHGAVYDSDTKQLVVVGGCLENKGVVADLHDSWILDATFSKSSTLGKEWVQGPTMKANRNWFGVASNEGKIYVVGGRTAHSPILPLSSIEIWDTKADPSTWQFETSSKLELRTGRFEHAVIMIAKRFLVVLGGNGGSNPLVQLSSVEIFDTHSESSSSNYFPGPRMNQQRGHAFAAIVGRNRLIASSGNSMESIIFNPKATHASRLFRKGAKWEDLSMKTEFPLCLGSVLSSYYNDGFFVVGCGGIIKYVDLSKREVVVLEQLPKFNKGYYDPSAVLVSTSADHAGILLTGGWETAHRIESQHLVEFICVPKGMMPLAEFDKEEKLPSANSQGMGHVQEDATKEKESCAEDQSTRGDVAGPPVSEALPPAKCPRLASNKAQKEGAKEIVTDQLSPPTIADVPVATAATAAEPTASEFAGNTTIQMKMSRRWLEWLELLKDFKEENGHLSIGGCDSFRGKRIGSFVDSQRAEYRRREMSALKFQKLDELGFVWQKKQQFAIIQKKVPMNVQVNSSFMDEKSQAAKDKEDEQQNSSRERSREAADKSQRDIPDGSATVPPVNEDALDMAESSGDNSEKATEKKLKITPPPTNDHGSALAKSSSNHTEKPIEKIALLAPAKAREARWLQSWELLRGFKKEKGQLPQASDIYRGEKIGAWMEEQQSELRKWTNGNRSWRLREWQIVKLNEIGVTHVKLNDVGNTHESRQSKRRRKKRKKAELCKAGEKQLKRTVPPVKDAALALTESSGNHTEKAIEKQLKVTVPSINDAKAIEQPLNLASLPPDKAREAHCLSLVANDVEGESPIEAIGISADLVIHRPGTQLVASRENESPATLEETSTTSSKNFPPNLPAGLGDTLQATLPLPKNSEADAKEASSGINQFADAEKGQLLDQDEGQCPQTTHSPVAPQISQEPTAAALDKGERKGAVVVDKSKQDGLPSPHTKIQASPADHDDNSSLSLTPHVTPQVPEKAITAAAALYNEETHVVVAEESTPASPPSSQLTRIPPSSGDKNSYLTCNSMLRSVQCQAKDVMDVAPLGHGGVTDDKITISKDEYDQFRKFRAEQARKAACERQEAEKEECQGTQEFANILARLDELAAPQKRGDKGQRKRSRSVAETRRKEVFETELLIASMRRHRLAELAREKHESELVDHPLKRLRTGPP